MCNCACEVEEVKLEATITDIELKKELDAIHWPIDYGSIKITIRNGKPTLVTIERTVKLDDHTSLPPEPKITFPPDYVTGRERF